jgi:hypothetical protein
MIYEEQIGHDPSQDTIRELSSKTTKTSNSITLPRLEYNSQIKNYNITSAQICKVLGTLWYCHVLSDYRQGLDW